jgi:hypothetical protein
MNGRPISRLARTISDSNISSTAPAWELVTSLMMGPRCLKLRRVRPSTLAITEAEGLTGLPSISGIAILKAASMVADISSQVRASFGEKYLISSAVRRASRHMAKDSSPSAEMSCTWQGSMMRWRRPKREVSSSSSSMGERRNSEA